MAWYNFRKKSEEVIEVRQTLEDILLQAGIGTLTVTPQQAMTIPAFSSSVHLISNTVAALPLKLYKSDGDRMEEVTGDPRTSLLNADTGDTLDGHQMKKSMVMDYLIYGSGYAVVNKTRNNIKSLHYVQNANVACVVYPDPVFKKIDFNIFDKQYRDYELIKLLRGTMNGGTGFGVVAENNMALSVAYNTLVFEEMLVKTGGNKKGFLKSQSRLSKEAMAELKTAWANLHTNNTENIIVLNNGLEFQESNNSAVEMQINQNKVSNNNDIYNMFGIPVELMGAKPTGGNEEMYASFVKLTILPLLEAFEAAVNAVLLQDKEKGKLVFKFDTTSILMADIEKRFKAYDIAVKNGILQIDEIRKVEKYEPMGLDFIKLGLADVLYNPKTKEIYTPNTNAVVTMGEEIKQADGSDGAAPAKGETPAAGTPDEKGVKKDESGDSK